MTLALHGLKFHIFGAGVSLWRVSVGVELFVSPKLQVMNQYGSHWQVPIQCCRPLCQLLLYDSQMLCPCSCRHQGMHMNGVWTER